MKKAGLFALIWICFFPSLWTLDVSADELIRPPQWCSTEDYIQIEGSKAYQGACWEELQAMRNAAVEGEAVSTQDALQLVEGYDGGLSFELGLIAFQSACNAQDAGQTSWESHLQEAEEHFRTVAEGEPAGEAQRLAWLWYARCGLLSEDPDGAAFQEGMARLAAYPDFQARTAVVCASMDGRVPADKLELLDAPVILLDGQPLVLSRDSWPEVVENRTMLPIRSLAESIGCWVEWDGGAQTVTIRRAGDVLTFTMGSDTALLGGLELPLETAPYVRDSRTFLPARAFLETMEQSVEWVQGPNVISVTENRALVGESAAIEDWVLALAPFNDDEYLPEWDFSVLGGGPRSAEYAQFCRDFMSFDQTLATRRASVINSCQNAYKNCLNYLAREKEEKEELSVYFRANIIENMGQACLLAQVAYGAGYFTYSEVLYYCQDLVELFRTSFQSWADVQEAYLYSASLFKEDGYIIIGGEWIGDELVGGIRLNTYEFRSEKLANAMEARPDIYEDALFQQEIVWMTEEPENQAISFKRFTLSVSGDEVPIPQVTEDEYPLAVDLEAEDTLIRMYEIAPVDQDAFVQEYLELLFSQGFTIHEEETAIPYAKIMAESGYEVTEDMIERSNHYFLEKPSISEGRKIYIRVLSPFPLENGKEGLGLAILFE